MLHVISGLRGGGAEHFVLELCKQSLRSKNAEMCVLSLAAVDEISYKFSEAGISVLQMPHSKNKRSVSAFNAFKTLLKHPYTNVHAHMFHACIIACIAKMFRPSLRIFFTLHNNISAGWHRQLLMFLTRPLRKADIVFPGMPPRWFQKSNAVIIGNGVDTRRFDELNTSKPQLFTCVFAGRLSPEKNPLFLINLAKSLLPEYDFMIRVAGEGPLERELIRSISVNKLSDHFSVHGHLDDIAPLLAESHCVLIPSLWEGMPLILLEAAAAGVPVVATPVGNIPYLLNKENGFIGSLNDFPLMVKDVMNNYGDALIKARRLKSYVEQNNNINTIYEQHMQVYQR